MDKMERTQGNRTQMLMLPLPRKDEAVRQVGGIQKNRNSQEVIAMIEILIVLGSLLSGYLTFRKRERNFSIEQNLKN